MGILTELGTAVTSRNGFETAQRAVLSIGYDRSPV